MTNKTLENQPSPAGGSKKMLWAGWIVSAIPVLMMGILPIFYLTMNQSAVMDSMQKYGYPEKYAFTIFFLEMGCALIYAIPQTAVLGAILLTGYLGGAVATHMHADEIPNVMGPVLFAALAWLGLFLRDARLRALVPWRR